MSENQKVGELRSKKKKGRWAPSDERRRFSRFCSAIGTETDKTQLDAFFGIHQKGEKKEN